MNPDVSGEVSPEDPEIKAVVCVYAIQAAEQAHMVMRFMSHFPSWILLKRRRAWLIRLKSWLWDRVRRRKQLKTVLAQSGLDKEQFERRMEQEMHSVKTQAAQRISYI